MMTWWFYVRKRPELENYPRPMISQHTFSIQISIIHMIWDVGEFDRFGHQDQRIKLFVGNSLVPNWEIWEVVLDVQDFKVLVRAGGFTSKIGR